MNPAEAFRYLEDAVTLHGDRSERECENSIFCDNNLMQSAESQRNFRRNMMAGFERITFSFILKNSS
jgi:hypothetical protein